MGNTTRRLLNGGAQAKNVNMCMITLGGRLGRTGSYSNALHRLQCTNCAPTTVETAAYVWTQKIKHGLKTTVIVDGI